MIKTYAHLLIAAALFVAACIGYGIWYHELGSMSATVSAISEEVTAKQQDAVAARLAAQELERLSGEEDAIRAYFVRTDDIVTFLESLQKTATTVGANVTVVSVSANSEPRPHLDLALKVTGSFSAVAKAVGAIEYGPYDIRTKTLTLDTADADTAGGWAAAMTLTVGTASSTTAKPDATDAATTTP